MKRRVSFVTTDDMAWLLTAIQNLVDIEELKIEEVNINAPEEKA